MLSVVAIFVAFFSLRFGIAIYYKRRISLKLNGTGKERHMSKVTEFPKINYQQNSLRLESVLLKYILPKCARFWRPHDSCVHQSFCRILAVCQQSEILEGQPGCQPAGRLGAEECAFGQDQFANRFTRSYQQRAAGVSLVCLLPTKHKDGLRWYKTVLNHLNSTFKRTKVV